MKLGKVPLHDIRRILEEAGVNFNLDANPLEKDTVISTNPAIGVPLDTLGFFAFHYSASNVAVAFAKPLYSTLAIIAPPSLSDQEIEAVIQAFSRECNKYDVKLKAGHTARYEGVEYPLVVSTVIGRMIRERLRPVEGDAIYLVGLLGAESSWLLGHNVPLEEMTPLEKALKVQGLPSVKLMHDVSEGGILGALIEISNYYRVLIKVNFESIATYPGVPTDYDPLTIPTYGVLLVITSSPMEFEESCRKESLPCTRLGIIEGSGVGVEYRFRLYVEAPQSPLVELYNPYTPGSQELAQVLLAAKEFLRIKGAEKLVPEVGTNIAFAKTNPLTPSDVAAIDGRIVRTASGIRICGMPAYGASKHLARVILEAIKNNPSLRAAINLRPEQTLIDKLRREGVEVVELKETFSECPVSHALAKGARGRAFYYHSIPDLEPSLVLLGENPTSLVELIKRALEE